jgi:hypothetical protein
MKACINKRDDFSVVLLVGVSWIIVALKKVGFHQMSVIFHLQGAAFGRFLSPLMQRRITRDDAYWGGQHGHRLDED